MAMTNKQKQWQLYYLDFYDYHVINIDGVWADGSVTATKSFQRYYGLVDDGIFGPLTEAKTVEVIKKIQSAISTYGSQALVIDGLAGPKTMETTKKYQLIAGLVADGIAGELTRAKIAGTEVDTSKKETTTEEPDKVTGTFWDRIKYFDPPEFACHCGGKYCNGFPKEMQEKLIVVADRVREHFGAPMTVSSGVRCTRHNAAVGGVSNSRHLDGKAMDFAVRGKSSSQVLAYVQQQPEIRYAYAIDSGYVHMDIL